MSEQKKPMSVGRAVFTIAMFIFWLSLSIYFAHHIYVISVVRPAEIEKIYQEGEAKIEALDREYCSDPEQAAYDKETCDKYVGLS